MTWVLTNDDDEPEPTEPGWYPTLRIWEIEEGQFPAAHFWTGSEWADEGTGIVIRYWPLRFDDKQAADDFAWAHDPDW